MQSRDRVWPQYNQPFDPLQYCEYLNLCTLCFIFVCTCKYCLIIYWQLFIGHMCLTLDLETNYYLVTFLVKFLLYMLFFFVGRGKLIWLKTPWKLPIHVSFWYLASVRRIHRLCVLGKRFHGDPLNIEPGSNERVSSEVLLHWRHHTFTLLSWRGHHKWPSWATQVQVCADVRKQTHLIYVMEN